MNLKLEDHDSARDARQRAYYRDIPKLTREALIRYIKHRIRPGRGLQAILSNNLRETISQCDDQVLGSLRKIIQWLYCSAPSQCWGSPKEVETWLNGEEPLGSTFENALSWLQ